VFIHDDDHLILFIYYFLLIFINKRSNGELLGIRFPPFRALFQPRIHFVRKCAVLFRAWRASQGDKVYPCETFSHPRVHFSQKKNHMSVFYEQE